MAVILERVNSVPTDNLELTLEFKQWVSNLVDSLNNTIEVIESKINGGGGGGLTWLSAAGATAGAINHGYISSGATITLPATCAVGDIVRVVGVSGWTILPSAGQNISIINVTGTVSVTSSSNFDALELICSVANTSWVAGSLMTTGVTIL